MTLSGFLPKPLLAILCTVSIGACLLLSAPAAAAAKHPNPDSSLRLGLRTFEMMGMMLTGPGLGQSWPGLRTWRTSMAKYQAFSRQVDASGLAADKKKHMKTCAKISSVIKGITGSSFLAYTTTMTIGVAKEWFDGIAHALTGQGHKEYLDLEADHVGARLVYQDTPPESMDSISSTFDDCQRLWQQYGELVDSGRYEEAEAVYQQWLTARHRFDDLYPEEYQADDQTGQTSPGGRQEADLAHAKSQYESWNRRYIEFLQAGHPINASEVQEALEKYRYWRDIYQRGRSR